MKKKLFVVIPVLVVFLCAFAQKKTYKRYYSYNIRLSFTNLVGSEPLQIDSVYQNPFGEPFTVSQLKYYISNVSFSNSDGKEVKVPNTYFLVNEQDSASKNFMVNSLLGTITAVNFYLGVDSLKNVSGVQTNALDPLNGMFWTWSTGYIMAKMEAVSPLSKAPQQRVTYHIGGFKGENNVVKKISLPLSAALKLKPGDTATININADINKWFAGANDIKIADINFCMNPGPLANKIAANYAAMFSVTSSFSQ
ncbi:MAG: MbnP family protein [Bacteroidota bacterium]